jgi:hypothetical protein
MSIQAKVDELNSIKKELEYVRKKTAPLRKRLKELEDEICVYLNAKEQQGLKYKNMAIIKEQKTVHAKKKKEEKLRESMSILRSYGIHNPERVLKELTESQKGSPLEKEKLKIKPL